MVTWIVVADSARARIFQLSRKGNKLRQVNEFAHPESRAYERDLTSDRPGRSFDRMGPGRHAMGQHTSSKEHEAWKLGKMLIDEIEANNEKKKFDRLVFFAPPALLGSIRKMMSNNTKQKIACEINKNLAYMEEAEIIKHLPDYQTA